MTDAPQSFAYESMGTRWQIRIWDAIDPASFADIRRTILARSEEFDGTYSRFKETSLVWELSRRTGIVAVPRDLVAMLRLYERLHDLSGGRCNPLVGFALSDLGYDRTYSFTTKDRIRPVPPFRDALGIVDDEHIELRAPVLIDLGALGKGYFVDLLATFLRERGIARFLVDGSGDISYSGAGQPIRAGLEHPGDTTKVIGVVTMTGGAMCSSAGNRRTWGEYHHTIDPFTLTSPKDILAVWVTADSAALADGLTTCLFLGDPEPFQRAFSFEYCILNTAYRVKRSPGFMAELY